MVRRMVRFSTYIHRVERRHEMAGRNDTPER